MNIQRLTQRIFNRVAKHLLTQGKKSLKFLMLDADKLGVCSYRGEDGTSCAVGCLIPDSRYTHALEGRGAVHKTVTRAMFPRNWRKVPMAVNVLLNELQSVHDTYPVEEWREHLVEITHIYKLNADVLKEKS